MRPRLLATTVAAGLIVLAALASAAAADPSLPITDDHGVTRLGPAWMVVRDGIYVLHLEGTDYEMAYQHGALLREQAGQGEVAFIQNYFRKEIEHSVIGGIDPLVNLAENTLYGLFFDPIARNIPPEARDSLRGVSDGAGLSYRALPRIMVTADAGQVIEGKVYGRQKLYPELAGFAHMGCTSFIAAGPATADGHVLHGRNLDFPGTGYFDRFPVVAFCQPASGQRYVMFTSAGVPCAGITAMNESGLAIGFHTAITKDVGNSGWPVLILGEKVVREATDLDSALAIIKAHPTAAGWILPISSAKDGRGVAVELSRHHQAVIPMTDHTLAVANTYRDPAMQADEIAVNWSYPLNSFHRTRRMNHLLREHSGRIDPQTGAGFLGDHFDENTGRERATGDVIGQYNNVSSVVMDVSARNFWVGAGPAPVCNSHYVGFNFEDGFHDPGRFTELPVLPGTWENTQRLAAYRLFIDADRRFAEDTDYAGALDDLGRAIALDPDEPTYAQIAGLLLLRTGAPGPAAVMFRKALALPQSPHKESLSRLWLARARDLTGDRDEARAQYEAALKLPSLNPRVKQAVEAGLKKPYSARQAPKISVDFSSGDSYSY